MSEQVVRELQEEDAENTIAAQPASITFDPDDSRLISLRNSLKAERMKLAIRLAEIDTSVPLIDAELGRRKNEREALTSRLPPELLGEIFEAAYRKWKPKREKRPAELVLSQVSSHWRNIAIRLSAIWTNIHVSTYRPIESLQTYLRRSQNQALTVTLDLGDMELRDPDPELGLLCAVEHIFRWRRLIIKAISTDAMHQTLGCLENYAAPALEEFKFQLCRDGVESVDPDSVSEHCDILRGGAPRLKSLHFDGFDKLRHWPPMSNVVTLYIHGVWETSQFTIEFRRLMVGPMCLTNLSIYGDFLELTPPPNAQFVIPTLRTLRLRYHPDDSLQSIFSSISAPSLDALHLVDAIDFDIELLINELDGTHPCPELKSLIIDKGDLTRDSFQRLTFVFPSVKHLTCVRRIPTMIDFLEEGDYFWRELATVHLTEDPNFTKIDASGVRRLLRDIPCLDENLPVPKVFFADVASFNMSREVDFMHFPFDFPGWQAV